MGNVVSLQLKPLLSKFYDELNRKGSDLKGLKESIINVLEFLTTPEGRTSVNCWAVNSFVLDAYLDNEPTDLPDDFGDVLADMGGALHDTVDFPNVAQNFESTPEQLLEKARKLEVK